jgi:serine/threonine protein kinase
VEPYDDQSRSQLFTVQIDSALTPVELFSRDLSERLVAEQVLESKYRVIALIGKGGMGAVYRAHHLRLGKDVALKTFLASELSDLAWVRFQREARAIARLDHPNVVKVFDFGVGDNGIPFYTMELLQGESLADRINGQGALDLVAVLNIFIQAAHGLAAAHAKGIVHRDIKPANIFLDTSLKSGASGYTAKIVDFGIASLAVENNDSGQKTTTGEVFGSPLYMSPEQFRGEELTNATDIYSFGCAFFEALVGRPPFFGANAFTTMHKHFNEPPPSLAECFPTKRLPRRLEVLVGSLLAKEPEKRPASFSVVIAELEAIAQTAGVVLAEPVAGRDLLSQPEHKPGSVKGDAWAKYWIIALVVLLGAGCLAMIFAGQISSLIAGHREVATALRRMPVQSDLTDAAPPDTFLPEGVDYDVSQSRLTNSSEHSEKEPPLIKVDSFERETFTKKGVTYHRFSFPPNIDVGRFDGPGVVWKGTTTVLVPGDARLEISPQVGSHPQILDGFGENSLAALKIPSEAHFSRVGITHIGRLKSLSSLVLTGVDLNADDVASLNKLSKLQALICSSKRFGRSALSGLKTLEQLHALHLEKQEKVKLLLPQLMNNQVMNVLHLSDCQLTDEDLEPISRMSGLFTVSIPNNIGVTDKGIKILAAHKALGVLNITNTGVTAAVLPILKSFPDLCKCYYDRKIFSAEQKLELDRYLNENCKRLHVQ